MKNFRVSLAVITPCDYVIEVEAKCINAAIAKAITALEGDDCDGDFFYCQKAIRGYTFNEESGKMSGIHVEEF